MTFQEKQHTFNALADGPVRSERLTIAELNVQEAAKKSVTGAYMGCIHIRDSGGRYLSHGQLKDHIAQMSEAHDFIGYSGDITDHGTLRQALLFSRLHANYNKKNRPTIAHLGNHDYDSNMPEIVKQIFEEEGGMVMLENVDYYPITARGMTIAHTGDIGALGGFTPYKANFFGDPQSKMPSQLAEERIVKLQRGLDKIRADQPDYGILMTHFVQSRSLLKGSRENRELWWRLGSSDHEEKLLREYNDVINAGISAHAHSGNSEGKTTDGIPLYNSAYPLRKKMNPQKPYLELKFEPTYIKAD